MAKRGYRKNHVFENIDLVVTCYCSAKEKLSQLFSGFALNLLAVIVVVFQFLSGIVPLAEMPGFTRYEQKLFVHIC